MLLSPQQFQQVSGAVRSLTPAQLAWVSGYISGLSQQFDATPAAFPAADVGGLKTTILYGSQTGNSKKVAEQLLAHLQAQGSVAVLANMKDYRPQQLKKEQRIVAVISTHGNGEPPDDARAFFAFLQSDRAPRLEALEFAVLALGDSSYEEFCQTGLALDQRLEALGAKRLLDRVDCDVDFAATAKTWQQQVAEKTPKTQDNGAIRFQPSPLAEQIASAAEYTAARPFRAELLNSIVLTDTGSDKDVLHLELSLEGSGIRYQPGDILAVAFDNDTALVDEILQLGRLQGKERVQVNGAETSLYSALRYQRELTSVTRRQLKAYAELIAHPELQAAAEDKNALRDWLYAADWVDVLNEFSGKLSAQQLVDVLRPLQPRQYSIASSPSAHPDEVHLLVKRVEYAFQGRRHLGTASNWLARLQAGELASVHLKPNPNFKLPQDPQANIIMIGAGTGVAPFRSFLFEREAQGVQGGSWLFFGEQHFRTDFLYQTEWRQLLENGALEHMSVAFSRDQVEKIYVQHRLLENGAEVWRWLQAGAYLYVCGDMNRMAQDVQQALLTIASTHGGKSADEAAEWLEQLTADRRYQRDVY
ncbi:assimilatory sulfite reductase (NADPH) flavoprotein subunit [Candidatus Thiothrix sp. Deng01]|uniref:Sulfite reductase [NADPH] flavoprotein alpha-component n=1 Tax=Candidatus Thiothrix phosphatis TaxID=3112415 RepID=A0ABU6CY98_9GAMM|nr:assimilatory sulfite reductase (NADPH) flavoprotein subunit [Candidatus Thiothrix sp. Deng01]MEB4591740.1 assimilatory sulfite reductase (NADPH) flavoprotein subunit [Candidatus Thiothrix sp. Deng01]